MASSYAIDWNANNELALYQESPQQPQLVSLYARL